MQQTYDGFVEALQKDPQVVDFTVLLIGKEDNADGIALAIAPGLL